jgi:hypothetical protein
VRGEDEAHYPILTLLVSWVYPVYAAKLRHLLVEEYLL